jgi:UDP-N-acetylmuramoyl-tripeptide--D-alanyl-D-alanine ligase
MYGDVPVHVENFKNREELIKEDEYLVKSLKSKGVLIFNSDCPDATSIAERCSKENKKEILSYGKAGDLKIRNISNDIKRKLVISQISFKNKMQNIECYGVLGDAAVYSALPAVIISDILNFDLKESLNKIKGMSRSNGRMKILEGMNNSVLIDDTYNSSPVAVMNGLKVMKSLVGISRKIVILGDMMELGKYAKDEHFKIGTEVAQSANILITVGSRSKATAEAAKEAGMGEGWILECKNSKEAGEEVLNILKEGDVVYVKGSQSMRMEKALKLLVSESVDIKKELVRQESEWLSR